MEYQCTRVAGAVHSSGNIVFAAKDNVLYSAIGNRVAFVDLQRSSANALGNFEARKDVDRLALTSDGVLLVAIDIDGRLSALNVPRRVVLHRLHLGNRCHAAAFSHDDGVLAVTQKRLVQLWLAPARRRRELAPFTKLVTFGGSSRETCSLQWAPDSKLLAVGSEDATVRVYVVGFYDDTLPDEEEEEDVEELQDNKKKKRVRAYKLAAHKAGVVAVFWVEASSGPSLLLSCARDCVAAAWQMRPASELDEVVQDALAIQNRASGFKLAKKHFLWSDANDGGRGYDARVAAADAAGSLLVAAFTSGVFAVYEVADPENLECVHRLSAARGEIDSVALDKRRGAWIALASQRFGQLAVWDWRNETFVLKQQGHDHEATCVAWAPDGRSFASGGSDSKLKLWSDQTGLCFATFDDHTAPVTAVAFAAARNIVLSASYDGTVRVYDLARYRNFRTLQAPPPRSATSTATKITAGASLISLAVDNDGDVACAGASDPFEIYVWSVRTGKLLDALAGHEGPVSCLALNPRDGTLASGSWDKTARIWNVFNNEQTDKLEHPTEVLAVAYRRDGKELACATLNGTIHIWEPNDARLIAVIDAQRDLAFDDRGLGGSSLKRDLTAVKHFDALSYSVDGRCVLAGGRSRFVCVYAVKHKVLVKKFRISSHRKAAGEDDDSSDDEERRLFEKHDDEDDDQALPGAQGAKRSGPKLARSTSRVNAVAFSPAGRSFVAVAPGAILVYSLVDDANFAPFDVDEAVTPDAVARALEAQDPARALVMALHLADDSLVHVVLSNVVPDRIDFVVAAVPSARASALLLIVATRLDEAVHLELYVGWLLAILRAHGPALRDDPGVLRAAQRVLLAHQRSLLTVVDDNDFALGFLANTAPLSSSDIEVEEASS